MMDRLFLKTIEPMPRGIIKKRKGWKETLAQQREDLVFPKRKLQENVVLAQLLIGTAMPTGTRIALDCVATYLKDLRSDYC
jgi:hypothetical protein